MRTLIFALIAFFLASSLYFVYRGDIQNLLRTAALVIALAEFSRTYDQYKHTFNMEVNAALRDRQKYEVTSVVIWIISGLLFLVSFF